MGVTVISKEVGSIGRCAFIGAGSVVTNQ